MAEEMINTGYEIISGGTDNHSMLIDLRSKNLTGKVAEAVLGQAPYYYQQKHGSI